MKVVLPGGSGQVGTILARAFLARGFEVVVLSRRPVAARWRVVEWDGINAGAWTSEIDGSDVVINLAGRSVNCRYNSRNRLEIRDSRVLPTRAVAHAIASAARPPAVWLQASTAAIYAHRYDAANDERTGVIDAREPGMPETWRFSVDVAMSWEAAAREGDAHSHTRLVLMRTGVVLSADRGGAFDMLRRLVRFVLGGREGDGRQFVSWIHHEDFVRAVAWLIDHDELTGAVNVTSPQPLDNSEFMRVLRQAAHVPIGLPASAWMLEIGAVALRTETELILKSRRVVPARLLDSGFVFRYPDWQSAATDLCGANHH